jgi:hypothetical protein
MRQSSFPAGPLGERPGLHPAFRPDHRPHCRSFNHSAPEPEKSFAQPCGTIGDGRLARRDESMRAEPPPPLGLRAHQLGMPRPFDFLPYFFDRRRHDIVRQTQCARQFPKQLFLSYEVGLADLVEAADALRAV